MRSLYALCAPLVPQTCAKRALMQAKHKPPASACARVWQHVGLHAHTARQNKKHMPHTENKHATEPHATLTLQHARTSSIAQRMAWLRENENEKMQNEKPTRPLPRVAFSTVAVLCA